MIFVRPSSLSSMPPRRLPKIGSRDRQARLGSTSVGFVTPAIVTAFLTVELLSALSETTTLHRPGSASSGTVTSHCTSATPGLDGGGIDRDMRPPIHRQLDADHSCEVGSLDPQSLGAPVSVERRRADPCRVRTATRGPRSLHGGLRARDHVRTQIEACDGRHQRAQQDNQLLRNLVAGESISW